MNQQWTRSPETVDGRIAYGARCTWWDSISQVGKLQRNGQPFSLPCCPKCHGVLFEVSTVHEWWQGAERYQAQGHPGYVDMLRWSRGQCFPDMAAMKAAYDQQGRDA